MITFRRPTALDLPVLTSLERTLFPEYPWSQAQFKEEIAGIGTSREFILAIKDGLIIGYAGIMVVAAGVPADLLTIAVLPDFRGQGIAQLMLTELESWAKAKGATEVILEVDTKNESAIRLYELASYEKISTRANYYGLGIDALVMRKELK
jgi:[ribosomal protein S18]-alanine N-acetyltransferase